jgi:hypothetical protein
MSTGDAVRTLQDALRQAGFSPGPSDGNFRAETYNAVKDFQHQRGLAVDGIVRPDTWVALGHPTSTRDAGPVSGQPRGVSVHIGVNRVDPVHYSGWSGPLAGCENDATDIHGLAEASGFQSKMLLTQDATAEAVLGEITSAAGSLSSGDYFLLTYAGHGAQVPDVGADVEEDQQDETWCLYNRMLLDDELSRAWQDFAPGVRIVVLSDSCHSGTVVRHAVMRSAFYAQLQVEDPTATRAPDTVGGFLRSVPMPRTATAPVTRGADADAMLRSAVGRLPNLLAALGDLGDLDPTPIISSLLDGLVAATERPRSGPGAVDGGAVLTRDAPLGVALATLEQHRDQYVRLQDETRTRGAIAATVLLISGCQDNQLSQESGGHGLFTTTLLRVWNNGAFNGDYRRFHGDILRQMPPVQSPNYLVVGPNAAFESQKPFTLTADRSRTAAGVG